MKAPVEDQPQRRATAVTGSPVAFFHRLEPTRPRFRTVAAVRAML
ncbi:hypothetical protein ACWFR5_01475 [Streptomyces sp. NPDC055092]